MNKWWIGNPWRMIQTNLREIDMEDMNAQRYVEGLLKFHPTAVLINVAGIISNYPTNIPDHFQSPHLHGDSLEKVINACKDAGLRVIARTDFSKIRRPIFESHPQWAYRDRTQQIVDYNGDVHACINGEYQQRIAMDIITELCKELPVDGIYINLDGFQTRDYSYCEYGLCHCQSCQERFKNMFGIDIPDVVDMSDPAYQKYCLFRAEVLRDYQKKIIEAVHKVREDIAIDGVDFIRMESNTELGRPLPHWQYSASSNTRCLRGIDVDMVSSNTSVDFVGYYYRHIAVSPQLQALRLWQNIANFGGLDYYLIGRLDNHEDKSGFEEIKKIFTFHHEFENEFQNIQSIAEVLVLRSYHWTDVSEEQGWIRVLTENHIPFDEMESFRILKSIPSRYHVVILPNIELVSDDLATLLDDFANEGGTVVAVANSACYNQHYIPRAKYAFDCMGLTTIPFKRDDVKGAMFHKSKDQAHLFPSLPKTNVIMCGEIYWYASYKKNANRILTYIPPHPYGPPERCYYSQITELPSVSKNVWGRGYGVYIPWMPGTLYRNEGYANTFHWMSDFLKEICNLKDRVLSDCSPMVEITVGLQHDKRSLLVQMVNGSGHFGTSYFDPLPIMDIPISIKVPKEPLEVIQLHTGESLAYTYQDGILCFRIPRLHWFISVKIILS